MRETTLRPEFVETVPDSLETGVLYVSMPYATAIHLCACGCRQEVVTPISPSDWQLEYDGEAVTLRPSIGNWRLPCRSHYWIRRGRVDWAADSGAPVARVEPSDAVPVHRTSLLSRARQTMRRWLRL
ncbi:MAG: DUF6527 family protein [Dehalococcoidia bacterium]